MYKDIAAGRIPDFYDRWVVLEDGRIVAATASGRPAINARRFAGQNFQFINPTLDFHYSQGVDFDMQGLAIMDPHAIKYPDWHPNAGQPIIVKIDYMIGGRGKQSNFSHLDAEAANLKIFGQTTIPDSFKQALGDHIEEVGLAWHHVQDLEHMILVPFDLHNAVKHLGGAEIAAYRNEIAAAFLNALLGIRSS